MELLIALLTFGSLSMIVYVLVTDRVQSASLKTRLSALTTQDSVLTFEDTMMSRSIKERIFSPFFATLGAFFSKYSPRGVRMRAIARLSSAGYANVDPSVYMGVRVVSALILLGIVAGLMMKLGLSLQSSLIYAYIAPVIGFFIPDIYLRMAGEQRKAAMTKTIPDLLDLLTVSVEAGLGFDQSLVLAAEKMKGPLIKEVRRTFDEMQMGKSRADALRSMAERCNIADFTSVVAALIQSDQLGVPVANVLRVQSDSMRIKRRQRAEEQAMKAPLKILFPLVFFIFPPLFIIILAPAVLNIIDKFRVQ